MPERRLLQGNTACALAALDAGCLFYAGYPITPSSEIAEEMARRLPARGGVFVQMEDEMASLAAVLGASIGGLRAMTATSGPGFSLMQEHLGFGAMAEVPCVVVDVMRGGPSTGLPTSPAQGDVMQARWGTHGDRPAVVLAPAAVQEVYELTVRAFQLADLLRTPVVVAYDEVVGHLKELAELSPPPAPAPRFSSARVLAFEPDADGVARPAPFGSGARYHVTGLAHDRSGLPTGDPVEVDRLVRRLAAKATSHPEALPGCACLELEDAEVACVAYGISARAAEDAVRALRARGRRVGLLRLRTLWPVPAAEVAAAAERLRGVVVAEMHLGQMVNEVERAVAGRAPVRLSSRVDGEAITPAQVAAALEEFAI